MVGLEDKLFSYWVSEGKFSGGDSCEKTSGGVIGCWELGITGQSTGLFVKFTLIAAKKRSSRICL